MTGAKHSEKTKETVKRLYKNGLTYREIGHAVGVSRSAVNGLVERMGLARRIVPLAKPVAATKHKPITTLVAPIAIGPVDDLPANGCKWIAGDPSVSWQCCGHPIDRQSLCSFHANIAFTKPLPAKSATQVNLNARAARVIR